MLRVLSLAIALALTLGLGQPAAADGDDAQIKAAILDQIDAIGAGDAHRAFGHATPNIQTRFGSSTVFMNMVQNGYNVLIRPKSFEIVEVLTTGDKAAARARLVARNGQIYRALYPMERQADGAWRIDGCYLERAEGRAS